MHLLIAINGYLWDPLIAINSPINDDFPLIVPLIVPLIAINSPNNSDFPIMVPLIVPLIVPIIVNNSYY